MTDPRDAPLPSISSRAPWWSYAVLVGAAFAAYHNSWHAPFAFDHAATNLPAAGGLTVERYHLFNWLIHVAAGLTLFSLVRRTPLLRASAGGAPPWPIALTIAVLWLVHPLQTES